MMKRRSLFVLPMLFCAAPLFAQTPQACEGLRSLSSANTVVTAAAVVSGRFTPPGSSNPNATIANLPAFCRVEVTLKPTPDSEIRTEIWMPMSGWNRKLQSVGNGAWAGVDSIRRDGGGDHRRLRHGRHRHRSRREHGELRARDTPNAWSITATARFTR